MALIGAGFSTYVCKLFNDPELSDVTIVLDNDEEADDSSAETKTFHGHRLILATMSDYFRSMLFGSFVEATKKEVRLRGVPYSTFVKIMEFVYLGKTVPSAGTLDEAVEFYSLVRMLLMDSKMTFFFATWMIEHLESAETWKKDLLKIFALAFEWDIPRLALKCSTLFSEIANEYLANSMFLELPLAAVQKILDASDICCTRAELNKAIQAWIIHHKREISAEVVAKLNRKVSRFGKHCYGFNELSLCRKKNQPHPNDVKSLVEYSEPMEALLAAAHEYTYKSEMSILKCICLRGIKICLRANQQFGPQHGRIKSELELCFKIEWNYNEYQRNLTVRYDFTKQHQQTVTIFFPEMTCCKDNDVIFNLSWKGSGVQPLLINYGPAKKNKKIETESTYVTHIIYLNQDYGSDGRCSECPISDYNSDWDSWASYYNSSDDAMETELSENDSED